MINALPLTIESMVAILLLLTILYCVRLNSQLKRLKADESSMRTVIAELVTATATAERAIAGLKATVHDAEAGLTERLQDAERYCADIQRSIKGGAEVLDRLTQIADARPWLMGVQPAKEVKTAAPDPKAIMAAAQAFAERARARIKATAA